MTKTTVKGFSLTDLELKIVSQVSADRRLHNDSAALRQIIVEWAQSNLPEVMQEAQPSQPA